MHGRSDTQSAAVPAFLTKLWTLVEDPSTDELICWSSNGTAFFVLDQARFAREILPMYFKHSNIASFIRQLNMYGFRKVTGIESGGLKLEKDEVEFAHPYFLRDQEHMLEKIKRKVTNQGKGDAEPPVPVGKVLEDVQTMHDKQSVMSTKLDSIKRENQSLWREVASLRQKHNHQQQIVNKLIQFLVALVGPSRTKLGTAKRKMPLMLTNEGSKSAKIPKMQRQLSYDFDTAIGGASITEVESPTFERRLNDASHLNEGSSVTINDITEDGFAETFTGLETPFVTSSDATPIIQSPGGSQTVVVDADGTVGFMPTSEVISSDTLEPVAVVQSSFEPGVTNVNDFLQMDDHTSQNESADTADDENVYMASTVPASSNLSSSSSSLVSVNPPKVPLHRLPSYHDLNNHVESVDTSLEELKDLLSGGQYTVDANALLGLFNTEVPPPVSTEGLIDLLDDTPKPPTEEEPAVSELPSSSIVGNEVIQYNPLDLNSLFDFGDLDLPTTEFAPLDNMETGDAMHDVLHTPTVEEASLLTSPVASKASKGAKSKRKGVPRKV